MSICLTVPLLLFELIVALRLLVGAPVAFEAHASDSAMIAHRAFFRDETARCADSGTSVE